MSNLVKWNEAKESVHDASGIEEPEDYLWKEISGVYYPVHSKKGSAIEVIKLLMSENSVNLTDVVDMVIENNGIIGVGLISLGEDLEKHCRSKI